MTKDKVKAWVEENLSEDIGVDIPSHPDFHDRRIGDDEILIEGPVVENGHRMWRSCSVDSMVKRIQKHVKSSSLPKTSRAVKKAISGAFDEAYSEGSAIRKYMQRKVNENG